MCTELLENEHYLNDLFDMILSLRERIFNVSVQLRQLQALIWNFGKYP